MKVFALFVSTLAAVSAFAPAPAGRANTGLSESFFDKVFNMDLFNPVKDQNNYGARSKKNLKVASIGKNSYVPDGLSASQYSGIRAKESAKKAANYKKNVAKAGIFEDFTQFYLDRGTDTSQKWAKSVTNGHRMTKMKYDFDTFKDGKKYDGGNAEVKKGKGKK